MESAKGLVKSVNDGIITVVVDKAPACARCSAGKGCGAGLLSGAPQPVVLELTAPAGISFHSGDTVQLSVSHTWLLKAAFFAYGVPLIAAVFAAGFAWAGGSAMSDLAAAGISLIGLAGGIVLSRYLLRRTGLCDQFEPRLEDGSGAPAV